MLKRALITGIYGQDGSYLAELLLRKGYEVHGVVRKQVGSAADKIWRVKDILQYLIIHECDLLNEKSVINLINKVMPDEVYHLASDLNPLISSTSSVSTFKNNSITSLLLLQSLSMFAPSAKTYVAGSSLMFGDTSTVPQNEHTNMMPTTPYGIGKLASYNFVRMFRDAYGMHCCTGILYNHDSPRRDDRFVLRKITKTAARIKHGKASKLVLGDVNIGRDWLHAKDVVRSMWLMLQAERANDFVIGSGSVNQIKDALSIVFDYLDMDWQSYVVHSTDYERKVDYRSLIADAKAAENMLNWRPQISFREMLIDMLENDLCLEACGDD